MTLSCISWQLAVSFHLRGGTASELAQSQSRVLQAKTRCWPGYVPIVVAGSRRVHDTCLSVFLCVCLSVSRSVETLSAVAAYAIHACMSRPAAVAAYAIHASPQEHTPYVCLLHTPYAARTTPDTQDRRACMQRSPPRTAGNHHDPHPTHDRPHHSGSSTIHGMRLGLATATGVSGGAS